MHWCLGLSVTDEHGCKIGVIVSSRQKPHFAKDARTEHPAIGSEKCSIISVTASNWRTPLRASLLAISSGSETNDGSRAWLCPSGSSLMLWIVGRFVDHLPRNAWILNLGIPIGEAATLLFLFRCWRVLPSLIKKPSRPSTTKCPVLGAPFLASFARSGAFAVNSSRPRDVTECGFAIVLRNRIRRRSRSTCIAIRCCADYSPVRRIARK